jgi:hypothetical protein
MGLDGRRGVCALVVQHGMGRLTVDGLYGGGATAGTGWGGKRERGVHWSCACVCAINRYGHCEARVTLTALSPVMAWLLSWRLWVQRMRELKVQEKAERSEGNMYAMLCVKCTAEGARAPRRTYYPRSPPPHATTCARAQVQVLEPQRLAGHSHVLGEGGLLPVQRSCTLFPPPTGSHLPTPPPSTLRSPIETHMKFDMLRNRADQLVGCRCNSSTAVLALTVWGVRASRRVAGASFPKRPHPHPRTPAPPIAWCRCQRPRVRWCIRARKASASTASRRCQGCHPCRHVSAGRVRARMCCLPQALVAREHLSELWTELGLPVPSITRLDALCLAFFTASRKADETFRQLMHLNPNVVVVMRRYAQFLGEVRGRDDAGIGRAASPRLFGRPVRK